MQEQDRNSYLSRAGTELEELHRITAQAIAAIGTLAFLATITALVLSESRYDSWVLASHIALVVMCSGSWIGMRIGRLQPVTALYAIGILFALSNAILLQRVPEPVQISPTIILMVIALSTPLPFGVTATVVGLSIANLALATYRFEWAVNEAVYLVVLGSVTTVAIAQVVRRRRELFYLNLRAEALIASDQIVKAAERERQFVERMARDDKLRSLGSLAGGVVHDLNNVLTPVLANAELLSKLEMDREAREYVDEISNATQRASQLTGQLNAFAGGAAGLVEPLDLCAEITAIRELVWRGAPPNVRVQWQPPSEPIWVAADKAQLHQIISNLLINAVEATQVRPDGLVVVDVTVNDRATLSVRDNGYGMPEELVTRAFEPFVSTKGRGRGLGLSAVHGAVTRLGGEIDLESDTRGTTVVVRLPVALGPAEPVYSSSAEVRLSSALVVDDDPEVRRAIAAVVGQFSESVDTAASAEEAIARLDGGERPEVIFMDLRMPGMSGSAAIEPLRQMVATQPIVLVTGYSDDALDQLEAGEGLTVVLKPATREQLEQAAATVLH